MPSEDGKLALFTQSSYSFETRSKTNEIRVLDLVTSSEVIISKDPKASEPRWLGTGHEVVWLKEGENGNTSFVVSDASLPGKTYVAGTVPGPVSSLKVFVKVPGKVAVAVAGQSNPDGSLWNPKDAQKPRSTARIYDSLFVRHWDSYITAQRASIFTGLLEKSIPKVTGRVGRYNLLGFANAISRESKLECPIPTFGGTDHFDIGPKGVTLVAKDPKLNPATHTKCNLYFVPVEDFTDMSTPEPIELKVPGAAGAATSPVFSPDGHGIAFLKMKEDGYESDRNLICLVREFVDSASAKVSVLTPDEKPWTWQPGAVSWSVDGKSLYVQAEDTGRVVLYSVDIGKAIEPGYHPKKLTRNGSVLDVAPASATSNLILVSANSLVDNSFYYYLDASTAQTVSVVSSLSNSGAKFGLSAGQVSELWWKGDQDRQVHAWIVKPSSFRVGHKYPLAYLIHGGPQGAWNDQWSSRWNPALFAEQGYVVVCPDPTGSTGYGQAFTDAIRNNWGGSPYIDLVKGFEYIEAKLGDFVDTSRAVALGASYGGYMMNWIQGHELGKKFKALVCHDGVFSMSAQLASDEQYFPVHDLGGPLWERQAMYDKWDPSRFAANWTTPMLVIHNELDYRLTIAEGLSAFNVLQMKGIPSRFLSFPDENHWVLKPENSLVWHTTVLNWINHHVGLTQVVADAKEDIAL
ncbi:hypothetical protein DV736_g61, partial [Chaetothyriales sp. CBS 134916]